LKFKDFQGPLTSNSKTFKALFHFEGLSRSWKNGDKNFKDFQELSRPCGHPVFCAPGVFDTVQTHRMHVHKFTAEEYTIYRIDYLSILTTTFPGDLG